MAGSTLGSDDFEYDNGDGCASFPHVFDSQYCTKAVGIANGNNNGTFRPESSITREELATMLSDYAKRVGLRGLRACRAARRTPDVRLGRGVRSMSRRERHRGQRRRREPGSEDHARRGRGHSR